MCYMEACKQYDLFIAIKEFIADISRPMKPDWGYIMGHKVRVYNLAILFPGLDMRNLKTEEQGSVWPETPDWRTLKVLADLLCHTAHLTLSTAHCTLHIKHCTLDSNTAHRSLNTAHCTLHRAHYKTIPAYYRINTAQWTLLGQCWTIITPYWTFHT